MKIPSFEEITGLKPNDRFKILNKAHEDIVYKVTENGTDAYTDDEDATPIEFTELLGAEIEILPPRKFYLRLQDKFKARYGYVFLNSNGRADIYIREYQVYYRKNIFTEQDLAENEALQEWDKICQREYVNE